MIAIGGSAANMTASRRQKLQLRERLESSA
jgi:hypothetical protein